MLARSARRILAVLVAGSIALAGFGCSGGSPEVGDAVVTPDPTVKPPPEPMEVQPVTSPATAGASSAPSPSPAPLPAPAAAPAQP